MKDDMPRRQGDQRLIDCINNLQSVLDDLCNDNDNMQSKEKLIVSNHLNELIVEYMRNRQIVITIKTPPKSNL